MFETAENDVSSSLRVASRGYDYGCILQVTASDDEAGGSVTREWTRSRYGGAPLAVRTPRSAGPHIREIRWRLGRPGSEDARPGGR